MLNYAKPTDWKPGTKTVRFNNFAEARLGLDGVWRLWELIGDADLWGETGHAAMEIKTVTWVVTQTSKSLRDLKPTIRDWRR